MFALNLTIATTEVRFAFHNVMKKHKNELRWNQPTDSLITIFRVLTNTDKVYTSTSVTETQLFANNVKSKCNSTIKV